MREIFEDFTAGDWVKIILGVIVGTPIFWGFPTFMILFFGG